MKYLKKQEELNTIKFSDLENWDIRQKNDKLKFTGTKDFDLKLAKKTLELLNKFGFGILTIDAKDFLRRMEILLEPEKKLKEYRVSLSVKIPFNDYLENNEIEDFESLSETEQEEIENKYEIDGFIDPDEKLIFSVFFPMSIKSHEYNLSALSDASKYLKLLNDSFPEIIKSGFIEDDVLSDYTEGFKKFLNNKGLNITNNNIEDVPTINERIRKDTKFLAQLKDVCRDYNINYTNLMNEWIKIL